MSLPLLKPGLHPAASDALRRAGIPASRLGQTIGSASASAGTHDPDGEANGHPYTVCTDLRIADLSDTDVHALLSKLWDQGFVAFFRNPGHDHWPAGEARHCHIVWPGAPMKAICRQQCHDGINGKNGLASHAPYAFYHPSSVQAQKARDLFLAHNPANG